MLDPINMLDLLNYVTVANTDFSGIPDPEPQNVILLAICYWLRGRSKLHVIQVEEKMRITLHLLYVCIHIINISTPKCSDITDFPQRRYFSGWVVFSSEVQIGELFAFDQTWI